MSGLLGHEIGPHGERGNPIYRSSNAEGIRVERDPEDPTRATIFGAHGDVLGYARDVREQADGSLTWANEWR